MLATTMPLVMLALMAAVAREAPVGRFDQHGFRRLLPGDADGAADDRRLGGVGDGAGDQGRARSASRLLRPMHPLASYSADALAAMPMRAVVALPITVVALVSTAGQ